MRRWRAWLVRIRCLFCKDRSERELAEELESHLQMATEDGVRSGLTPAEARRNAVMQLGGVEGTKESFRDQRGIPAIETAGRDLAYAARMLRRSPGFTATVVLTLGLGIGATTAIFTVVNAVLLRPLPYPEPNRLVYIGMRLASHPEEDSRFSYTRDYAAWRDHSRTLSQLAGFMTFQANLTGAGEAERITGGYATASLLPLLGIKPALGRNFLPEEDRPGGLTVVILSHAFWNRRFQSDPSIVGKSLTLNSSSYRIIGVLPAAFLIPDRGSIDYDLWVPFAMGKAGQAKAILAMTIGRLAPGASVDAARAELGALMQQKPGPKRSVVVTEWHERLAGGAKRLLLIFFCAVGFVLLIACVNVANLLLARATVQDKEVAVRRALGAGKSRILGQFLTESVLLGLLGGTVGLAIAYWGKNVLIACIARDLPSLDPIRVDYRVLAFNLGLGLITGLAFGLAPALQASKIPLNESLKEASRGLTEGRSRVRLRTLLVVIEVALAMVLLSGAGLLLRSFLRLRGIDPGFRPDRTLTLNIDLTPSRYPGPLERTRFFQQAIARLGMLPGIQAVGAGTSLPLGGFSAATSGRTIQGKAGTVVESFLTMVSPGYFRALGIPVTLGRDFSDLDREGSPTVVMVNEAFARAYFTGESCIGRRIQNPGRKDDWMTVVGIVRDIRPMPERTTSPEMYLSYLQAEQVHTKMTGGELGSEMYLVIRTTGDPTSLASAVRRQISAIDDLQPAFDMKTLEARRTGYFAPRRVNMLLVLAFAALALILGAIGIYGVVSYSVSRRSHEIGVRMTLGAHRGEIVWIMLGHGFGRIGIGIGLGLLSSVGLTRLIASELWGVSTTDPLTYVVVIAVLAATGLAACLVPALRAARLDPVRALRYE